MSFKIFLKNIQKNVETSIFFSKNLLYENKNNNIKKKKLRKKTSRIHDCISHNNAKNPCSCQGNKEVSNILKNIHMHKACN